MSTTWLITGTSSGLGREMTRQLLAEGHRVAATLRRPEALDDLRAEYGDRLWVAALDVTDTLAVRDVVDRAFADLGTIDVVVNNAGYGVFASVEEASDDQIERVLRTNVIGSMQVVRAALPHLRAQASGRILQVSSAGGQATYPNFGYYHASKWAIEGFSQTVAAEIAPFGIGLTIVEPGATQTGFSTGLQTAPVMPEYDAGPAGDTRRAIERGDFAIAGDAVKVAREIIRSTSVTPAPLRLVLGRDSYDDVLRQLRARVEQIEPQREVAYSTMLDSAAPCAAQ
ncbi:short-chain dehydrogenase [Frondihabitans sp. PAMC 28766]|uniref:SDR family oxidoreductase n=1 Tax=Frondihabitans sp. PAMC 28766 TaxID=1795630 RepID=UPI00078E9A14|nr:SDR family oxidoreductase [Frondihabitans sp. PAMC 28766]AMM19765.1 short-chain dehydrogenase [Frondihabitans sp. PAMC 28766]